jgi:hypothetical protein
MISVGELYLTTQIYLKFDVEYSIHSKIGFKKLTYGDQISYFGDFVQKIYDNSIFISINRINSGSNLLE